jgi:hypothetical protein
VIDVPERGSGTFAIAGHLFDWSSSSAVCFCSDAEAILGWSLVHELRIGLVRSQDDIVLDAVPAVDSGRGDHAERPLN